MIMTTLRVGTLRRLKKEFAFWEKGELHPTESPYWSIEVHRQGSVPDSDGTPEYDYSKWKIILSPRNGPFRGGTFAWLLDFSKTPSYPFVPPNWPELLYFGVLLPFEKAEKGVRIKMTRVGQSDSSRSTGVVVDKTENNVTIKWENREGTNSTEIVTKSWWNSCGRTMKANVELFTPFLLENNGGCICGIKTTWSPVMNIGRILSFIRVAVETTTAEYNKPVIDKKGAKVLTDYCYLRPDVFNQMEKDPEEWFKEARNRFLGINKSKRVKV
mmetsp:Transcript_30102/g.37109  ORF Transcript_30102/g.37109 Transcript_30102/m.37109 type:complete len:271 (+) Transcript_30102:84-896(+)